MRKPPLDPPVYDQALTAGDLTPYDQGHLVTYLRLLEAGAEDADWAGAARIVLHIDPAAEPERARRAWEPLGARQMDDCARVPEFAQRRTRLEECNDKADRCETARIIMSYAYNSTWRDTSPTQSDPI